MSEKDILQKAQDLVESTQNHQNQELPVDENQEKKQETKTESLKDIQNESSQEEDSHQKKLGYKRSIHYKNPKWWHFLGMGLIIIVLLWIIALLFPYIPPVL